MDSHPLPAIYDQILVFGGGRPATDGPLVGEIGGFLRDPDYGLSYLLAARYVLDRAAIIGRVNEVALPAVYLQRHALENALKDLIETARDIKAEGDWVTALQSDPKAPRPKPQKLRFEHDLSVLIGWLQADLKAISYGDVPPEFVAAAEQINEVERKDETRIRYPRGRDRKVSFPDRIVIPVGKLQDDLEKAFQKHLYLDSTMQLDNLGTNLAGEQQGNTEAILRLTGDV